MWMLILAVICIIGMEVGTRGQELDPMQPNVCLTQESTTEEKMVAHREPIKVATTTWCFSLPSRCTTYKTIYKVVYRPQLQKGSKLVARCCDGYVLYNNNNNNSCIPQCRDGCVNGQGVASDKCDCSPGYAGGNCTQKCLVGKWGPQCLLDCKCLNGGRCDSVLGTCECNSGWQGTWCQDPCPSGQYGNMCSHTCQCANGAECSPIDGACRCAVGFCGVMCEDQCVQ